ncbi:MAG: hypothetical protein KDD34_03930, partial [Bdellovibrionales bacterium]|nr:hypothetical protein [Bdellovibrionales bacterium]
MANIIVIENDPRVKSQIKQYLGELGSDEHKIRFFESQQAFEARYFNQANLQKQKPPLLEIPALKKWTETQGDWMLEHQLEQQAPFPGETLRLSHQVATQKITAIDPDVDENINIFGMSKTDLQATTNHIYKLIGTPFQPIFTDFLEKVINNTPIEPFTYPLISASSGQIWLLSLSAKLQGDSVVIEFKNVTETVRPTFNKEVEKRKKEAEEGGVELDRLGTIDLIIFKLNLIKDFKKGWVQNTLTKIKKFGLQPTYRNTKLILLKYEDDGIHKVDLLYPQIHDLVYLPLDRALFLQKVDIILNLPEIAKPQFLFQQDVEMHINLAKRTNIDFISDLGIGMRNPIALAPGLMGHFFLKLPSQEEEIEFYGKVQKSKPHQEYKNEFVVFFTFFGIEKDILSKIRRFLSQNPRYQSWINEDETKFEFSNENIFLTEKEKRIKNIAIVIPDEKVISSLTKTIVDHFHQVRVVGDTSYQNFLIKYLSPKQKNQPDFNPEDIQVATAKDLGSEKIIFYANKESFFIQAPPAPEEDDEGQILGHPQKELLSHSDKWVNLLFPLGSEKDVLKEVFEAVWKGRKIESIYIVHDNKMEPWAASLSFEPQLEDGTIKVTVTPAHAATVKEKLLREIRIPTIDTLIVDSHYVPEDVNAWVEGLNEACRQQNLLPEDKKLKIIILEAESHKVDISQFGNPSIRAIQPIPIDNRSFLVSL